MGMEALYQPTPTQVIGLNNFIMAMAGSASSLALNNNSNVWVWGGNYNLQLGLKDFNTYPVPTATDITNVIKLSTGDMNSVFLKDDGSVWVAGGNNLGQKGDGSISDFIYQPTRVLGPNTNSSYTTNSTQTNPIINNSTVLAISSNSQAAPYHEWFSIGIIVLALIILIAGCVAYVTIIRK